MISPTFTHNTTTRKAYTFKRRNLPAGERYEVWHDGVLLKNNVTYWAFLKLYQAVVNSGSLPVGWETM